MKRYLAVMNPAPAGLITLILGLMVLWSTSVPAQQTTPSNAQQAPVMQAGATSPTSNGSPGMPQNGMAGMSMAEGEWSDSSPVDHIGSPFPKPKPPSTRVRVTVLDASPEWKRAGQVAVLLTRYRKRELEEHIGMKLSLANISGFSTTPDRVNVLYYRPGFMRAAMLIAKAIPGEQNVAPMKPELERRQGIDVEVVLGAEVH